MHVPYAWGLGHTFTSGSRVCDDCMHAHLHARAVISAQTIKTEAAIKHAHGDIYTCTCACTCTCICRSQWSNGNEPLSQHRPPPRPALVPGCAHEYEYTCRTTRNKHACIRSRVYLENVNHCVCMHKYGYVCI